MVAAAAEASFTQIPQQRLWRQGSKLELSHLWHIIKGWYYYWYSRVIWHGRVMP